MSRKGFFRPRNPLKYKGNPMNIIYRSSWEAKLMIYLDQHPSVIQWSSEEFSIPYRSPIDGRIHRYFPDFCVKMKNKDEIIETILIEVKPLKQTIPPKVQTKPSKKYITEVKIWGVNSAKWKAAKEFCEDRKWTFKIMTERELNIPNG
jgi:hypothetical protein